MVNEAMLAPMVYVVDDDESVRDSLSMLLNFRGWRTRGFASAEDCLDAWRPIWRGCLLLDLRLGGMNGMELATCLTKLGNRMPVVFLTGHGDVARAREALKGGAVDFLEKPYEEADLIHAVREALRRDEQEVKALVRRDDLRARVERLSKRERQVFDRVVQGIPNRDMAEEFGLSPRTVEVFRARMMEKMQARSVPELVRFALEAGVS